jgi:hypothetical protein
MSPIEEREVADFLGHLNSAISSAIQMVGLRDTAIVNKIKSRVPIMELVRDDIHEDFLRILKSRKIDASDL